MPLYEYYCQTCTAPFEALRTMKQVDTAINCPRCANPTTNLMISLCAAHSTDSNGQTHAIAGSSGGCGSCAGGHCSSCSH